MVSHLSMEILCQLYIIIPKPKSVNRKKSNSVCHHAMCESIVMGKSLVVYVSNSENVTDLMAAVICGQRHECLVSYILYDIHDDL